MKKKSIASLQAVMFTEGQRADLRSRGLVPEQVRYLENLLPDIKLRLELPVPSSHVREKLKKLKKALRLIEKMPESKAGVEALGRLSVVQMWQQKDPQKMIPLQTLHTAASAAKEAVDDAIASIPKYRGKIRRGSPDLSGLGEIVALIVQALKAGHVDHCRGLAGKQLHPKFDIKAGRRNEPFTSIVGIVRDATGRWSVDEAIRAYGNNCKKIESSMKDASLGSAEAALRVTSARFKAGGNLLKKPNRSPKTNTPYGR